MYGYIIHMYDRTTLTKRTEYCAFFSTNERNMARVQEAITVTYYATLQKCMFYIQIRPFIYFRLFNFFWIQMWIRITNAYPDLG
jgi:hypothetical protein